MSVWTSCWRLGVDAVGLVGVGLFLLLALNCCNPLSRVFVRESEFHNATRQTLLMTPLATRNTEPEDGAERHFAPLYANGVFLLPTLRHSRFEVEHGEVFDFVWDWDDYRISDLVVETQDGRMLVQSVEGMASATIHRLDAWSPAPAEVRDLVESGEGHDFLLWLAFAGFGAASLRVCYRVGSAVFSLGRRRG